MSNFKLLLPQENTLCALLFANTLSSTQIRLSEFTENSMNNITILQQTRANLAKSAGSLSEEQLLSIPTGFRNNILWNLGHIIVTQQLLHYKRTGNEMYIPDDLVNQFRNGTAPADWETAPGISELLSLITELPNKLEEDFKAGKFRKYDGFTTSTGVTLTSIEEAISFNNFHEGLHTGIITAIRKLF